SMDVLKQQGGPALLPEGIFREYDIRGIAGDTLTADGVYRIARAFASLVAGDEGASLCVGRDGRISSFELARAAAQGVSDAGVSVIDVGLGPTPMLYFAAHTLAGSGGIMITGSHNPP